MTAARCCCKLNKLLTDCNTVISPTTRKVSLLHGKYRLSVETVNGNKTMKRVLNFNKTFKQVLNFNKTLSLTSIKHLNKCVTSIKKLKQGLNINTTLKQVLNFNKTFLSTTNKMQRCIILFIIVNALHVSSSFSLIIRSSNLYMQHQVFFKLQL
jgi:hypothetical protein